MSLLVGKTILRYKIATLLGEGGMGAVYKARDITLQRDVAVKVMHPQYSRQPTFQERFLQEDRTAARFRTPISFRCTILASLKTNCSSLWNISQVTTWL